MTEAGDDVSLGAVIASRRHRDNYEVAYLAARSRPRARADDARRAAPRATGCSSRASGGSSCARIPTNEASQRLAERAGFQREGLERKSIWLHGSAQDAIVWSLLPDDPR